METTQKLAILADAAKYDASCASSGTSQRDSVGGKRIGSTEGSGICHSYAPDGRCISLLKILLTNFCTYDCLYCVNRVSSNVPRARFSVDEVVQLTLSFYRRNCIEGLFLSSGIIQSPDYTMERVVEVARVLREEHDFRGYIHLKTIPDASSELLARAGRYADRLSINIELPTVQGLEALAPEKDSAAIKRSMARLRLHIDNAGGEARDAAKAGAMSLPGAHKMRQAPAPRFAPAGQSTQMIVGADASNDRTILQASTLLYSAYRMRRVYYSAFSPIPDASSSLPLRQPPLMREHRLYQADWLIRFYGFAHDEIVAPPVSGVDGTDTSSGMLALDIDPKLAWALAHRAQFPVDVNRAPREMLLRVPGLGVKAVVRILAARRVRQLRADDLLRLHVPLKKVMPFVLLADHHPGATLDAAHLAASLSPAPAQRGLFDEPEQHAPIAAAPSRLALPDFSGLTARTAPADTAPLPTAPSHPGSAPLAAGLEDERHSVWA
ncbi:MAG: putative DNA modification/repair radical SAM protein [Polaromonas sp.]|nr:putative DNA modification/repair radical SAM protein [Polaromonas sp.]